MMCKVESLVEFCMMMCVLHQSAQSCFIAAYKYSWQHCNCSTTETLSTVEDNSQELATGCLEQYCKPGCSSFWPLFINPLPLSLLSSCPLLFYSGEGNLQETNKRVCSRCIWVKRTLRLIYTEDFETNLPYAISNNVGNIRSSFHYVCCFDNGVESASAKWLGSLEKWQIRFVWLLNFWEAAPCLPCLTRRGGGIPPVSRHGLLSHVPLKCTGFLSFFVCDT